MLILESYKYHAKIKTEAWSMLMRSCSKFVFIIVYFHFSRRISSSSSLPCIYLSYDYIQDIRPVRLEPRYLPGNLRLIAAGADLFSHGTRRPTEAFPFPTCDCPYFVLVLYLLIRLLVKLPTPQLWTILTNPIKFYANSIFPPHTMNCISCQLRLKSGSLQIRFSLRVLSPPNSTNALYRNSAVYSA